jgi:hypothetical protein
MRRLPICGAVVRPIGFGRSREVLTQRESVEVVGTSPERFWAPCQTLVDHPDKRWSRTNCVSVLTMRGLGIQQVFRFDTDFQQAGFELLPSVEQAGPIADGTLRRQLAPTVFQVGSDPRSRVAHHEALERSSASRPA